MQEEEGSSCVCAQEAVTDVKKKFVARLWDDTEDKGCSKLCWQPGYDGVIVRDRKWFGKHRRNMYKWGFKKGVSPRSKATLSTLPRNSNVEYWYHEANLFTRADAHNNFQLLRSIVYDNKNKATTSRGIPKMKEADIPFLQNSELHTNGTPKEDKTRTESFSSNGTLSPGALDDHVIKDCSNDEDLGDTMSLDSAIFEDFADTSSPLDDSATQGLFATPSSVEKTARPSRRFWSVVNSSLEHYRQALYGASTQQHQSTKCQLSRDLMVATQAYEVFAAHLDILRKVTIFPPLQATHETSSVCTVAQTMGDQQCPRKRKNSDALSGCSSDDHTAISFSVHSFVQDEFGKSVHREMVDPLSHASVDQSRLNFETQLELFRNKYWLKKNLQDLVDAHHHAQNILLGDTLLAGVAAIDTLSEQLELLQRMSFLGSMQWKRRNREHHSNDDDNDGDSDYDDDSDDDNDNDNDNGVSRGWGHQRNSKDSDHRDGDDAFRGQDDDNNNDNNNSFERIEKSPGGHGAAVMVSTLRTDDKMQHAASTDVVQPASRISDCSTDIALCCSNGSGSDTTPRVLAPEGSVKTVQTFPKSERRVRDQSSEEEAKLQTLECPMDGTVEQTEFDKVGEKTILPQDTFSFFALGKPYSYSFFCATVVLAAQSLTYYFLLGGGSRNSARNILFDVPPDVSMGVRACQLLAIIITVLSENNIIASLNTFRTKGGADVSGNKDLPVDSLVGWYLSILLRFLGGMAALVATSILIMQTDTTKDVLLIFTAIRFVSFGDNHVFFLAASGFWGEKVRNDAEFIKQLKSKKRRSTLQVLDLGVMTVLALSFWFWVSSRQARGEFLCHRLFVQFGDEISPDLAYFSGVYDIRKSTSWGEVVEYIEAPHVLGDANQKQGYVPARLGYCQEERAWVFVHGDDAKKHSDLCDSWRAKSSQTNPFDITDTASNSWFVRSIENMELDHFHLSCYDCHNDGCGMHGKCMDNQCVCEVGWIGFRCEFAESCDELVIELQSAPFPTKHSLIQEDLEWPKAYKRLQNATAYNRPVFIGEYQTSVDYLVAQETKAVLGVVDTLYTVMFFTGRRWVIVSSREPNLYRGGAISETLFNVDFHAFWSDFTVEFKSEPADVGTAKDTVAPEKLIWFHARGRYQHPVEAILTCRGVFTDNSIQIAVREWAIEPKSIEEVHGNITTWDTSHLTDLSDLFSNTMFNGDVSSWKVSAVIAAPALFSNATFFNQDVSSWDVSSVVDMSGMFAGASSFNQPLLNWTTTSAKFMGSMFLESAFNHDISTWHTSSVVIMTNMFKGCSYFDQDLSMWDTSSVVNMAGMFQNTIVFDQGLSNWATSSVRFMTGMFQGAESFDQSLSGWDTSLVESTASMFQEALVFNADISTWDTSAVTDMRYMFAGARTFDQDLSEWNTSSVSNMSYMFYCAPSFNGNISRWNTSSVKSMSRMFATASGQYRHRPSEEASDIGDISTTFDDALIRQHNLSAWTTSTITCIGRNSTFNQDLSMWNTSAVESMAFMFLNAREFNTDVSTWDTSSATSMMAMFSGATAFNQNIANWNVGNVRRMSSMFEYATNFNSSMPWDTSAVISMSFMFRHAESFDQDISTWDTANVRSMLKMFDSALSFNKDSSPWNTSSVVNMAGMFRQAEKFNGDLSMWDTSNVKYMSRMFWGAKVFNGNVSTWDTSSVLRMEGMFRFAEEFNQDISSWTTASVNNMAFMFADAWHFNQDVSKWNTSQVKSMESMFSMAHHFNSNIELWDTSKVQTMARMFDFARAFNRNISAWNTESVTSMSGMFEDAWVFNQDLSNWETSAVQTMERMFADAISFNGSISKWDTSSVTDMSEMFKGAVSFNSNVAKWNTKSVQSMKAMFQDAEMFNQDLSLWNVSNVKDMRKMFNGAVNFNQVLCWYVNPHVRTEGMFCGCQARFNETCVDDSIFKASLSSCSHD